jgi:hypothetical protein
MRRSAAGFDHPAAPRLQSLNRPVNETSKDSIKTVDERMRRARRRQGTPPGRPSGRGAEQMEGHHTA